MLHECENNHCRAYQDPDIRPVKNGFFYRKSDNRYIQKYKCMICKRGYSTARNSIHYNQKRRDINPWVLKLISAGVSQRKIARLLNVSKNTIAPKIRFLSQICEELNKSFLYQIGPTPGVQLDEAETFEHTKLKPITIPMIAHNPLRFILGIKAAPMSAKGLLAKKSIAKYGKRVSYRRKCITRLLEDLPEYVGKIQVVESDECPLYPKIVKACLPEAEHITHKGRRGCVVGQGELKSGRWDPLFSLNHTFAMLRDNVKTLSRRTWCTVKKIERFQELLQIYMYMHNLTRLKELQVREGRYLHVKIDFKFS